jgi:hypothetical protein
MTKLVKWISPLPQRIFLTDARPKVLSPRQWRHEQIARTARSLMSMVASEVIMRGGTAGSRLIHSVEVTWNGEVRLIFNSDECEYVCNWKEGE